MLKLNDYVEVGISKPVSDYEYSLTLESIDDMWFYDELIKMEEN